MNANFDFFPHIHQDIAANILQNAVSIDLEALKLGDWSEMKSDSAISRWAFSGVAAHATRKLPQSEIDSKTQAKISYVNDWSCASFYCFYFYPPICIFFFVLKIDLYSQLIYLF